jgi:hypothetical protein
MSIQGDIIRENDVQFCCKKLAEKIQKYPEAIKALKEMGREMLEILPNIPEWAHMYLQLFRE